MPYISGPRREAFALARNTLKTTRLDNPGELAYILCWMCNQYLEQHPVGYQQLNDVLGAISCTQMEFFRKVAASYEDGKEKANGTVWGEEAK